MAEALRWMPIAMHLRCLRRVLAVLLIAWVLVQTVGVMHRVAHAQQSTGVSAHVATDASGVLAAIWGEHSNAAECQLFDQSCPDLLQVPVFALLPLLPAMHWTVALPHERFALVERFYAARGPPVWH